MPSKAIEVSQKQSTEPAVPAQGSIQQMADSFGPDQAKTIVILLSILDGMTGFALNGDMWYLACHQGGHTCRRLGISEVEFQAVRERFDEFRIAKKRLNPMSCMFDKE